MSVLWDFRLPFGFQENEAHARVRFRSSDSLDQWRTFHSGNIVGSPSALAPCSGSSSCCMMTSCPVSLRYLLRADRRSCFFTCEHTEIQHLSLIFIGSSQRQDDNKSVTVQILAENLSDGVTDLLGAVTALYRNLRSGSGFDLSTQKLFTNILSSNLKDKKSLEMQH